MSAGSFPAWSQTEQLRVLIPVFAVGTAILPALADPSSGADLVLCALAAAPFLYARGNHELCSRAGPGWFYFLDASTKLDGGTQLSCPPQTSETAPAADALSQLLQSEVQAGLVVDPRERLVGMVTVDQITATLQRS